MENHYRKYIAVLFMTLGVFCLITTAYFFLAIQIVVDHNGEILKELAVTTAYEEQKRAIDNVIIRIENKRLEVETDVADVINILVDSLHTMEVSVDMGKEILGHLKETHMVQPFRS